MKTNTNNLIFLNQLCKNMKTGIKVLDAMTKSPITTEPDCTIYDCAKKMLKHHVGSLLVVKNKKLLGIVTERDLLKRALMKNIDIKKTTIKRVMTKDILTITPDTDLYDAILFMSRYNTRRLPVLDKDKNIIGLITHKDILRIQPDLYDIIADKLQFQQIRELNEKPEVRGYMEGICQSCRSYNTLFKKKGKWLCESCKI
jgi:CBS domain-containing protein